MRRVFAILIIIISSIPALAQFDFYATATILSINGESSFFSNSLPGNGQNISPDIFEGRVLGTFGKNTAALKLVGAEAKTYKSANGNVCSAMLFYTVYPQGQRPSAPVYDSIGLGFFDNCNAGACGNFAGSFATLGCCSIGDQKWQFPGGGNGGGSDGNIDLTNREPGNYVLEVFYRFTGDDASTSSCDKLRYDNNNSAPANYTATFSISATLPVKFVSINAMAEKNGNRIYWTTPAEAGSKMFYIERSDNGKNFFNRGTITAHGSSAGNTLYQFFDAVPGAAFYRVRMQDFNGNSMFSAIVKTTNAGSEPVLIPSVAGIFTTVYHLPAGSIIRLISSTGASLRVWQTAGASQQIGLGELPNGHYTVQVFTGKNSYNLPLVVAK